MTLDAHVVVPHRGIDIAFTVATGETVALLGANGAGKSTALAVIAGLLRPAQGHVLIADRNVGQEPPHRRGVVLLSQDPLLFPHLTALDNVAFAPRNRGLRQSRQVGRGLLDRLDMGEFARRKPHQLSGGQAQRVAIARALAADPEIVLLDEPFAAVDVDSRPHLRHQVRDVLADRTAIIVTHDILDALALASRVIVLEDGHIVEDGPITQVLSRPRSSFAAGIAGFNIAAGRWTGTAADTAFGELHGNADEPLTVGESVVALCRPSSVAVFDEPPHGSIRNRVTAPISRLEPLGERIRVRVVSGEESFAADITAAAAAELSLTPGRIVTLGVKATEVTVLRAAQTEPSRPGVS
jgi:molybdopterin-binding protein